MLQRTIQTLLVVGSTILALSCWTSKKATGSEEVSYSRDVYPILVDRCTPCHFPEKGKKKMLDTYEAARNNINDIIERVSLPQDHREFMPYKLKKAPLTDSMVNVLVQWKDQGFPK